MTLTHIKLVLALMLLLSMQSCKCPLQFSQGGECRTDSRDTIVMNQILHDSTYVYDALLPLDSATISKYFPQLADVITPLPHSEAVGGKGKAEGRGIGAVHVESRWRIRHDSVFVHRVDTVTRVEKVPVEVVKEVARKRNWFDWLCYSISGLLVLGIILYITKRLLPW